MKILLIFVDLFCTFVLKILKFQFVVQEKNFKDVCHFFIKKLCLPRSFIKGGVFKYPTKLK